MKSLNKWGTPIIVISISIAIIWLFGESPGSGVLSIGLAITCFASYLIKYCLAKTKYGFDNFIIGENKTYSLSRLQFLLWVLFIISYQVGIIFYLIHCELLSYFELQLAENILWILAASFGTYISVKGIATTQKRDGLLPTKDFPQRIDLISGKNGLDFTRFQMLIWTIIALVLFTNQAIQYNNGIVTATRQLLLNQEIEKQVRLSLREFEDFERTNNIDSLPYLMKAFELKKEKVDLLRESATNSLFKSDRDAIHTLDSLNTELIGAFKDGSLSLNDSLPSSILSFKSKYEELNQGVSVLKTEAKDKLQLFFRESTEKEPNNLLPEISVTFLILMGLIKGTYVGKKLLPVGATGTQPEEPFTPNTLEGRRELAQINAQLVDLKLKEALEIAQSVYYKRDDVTGIDIGNKYLEKENKITEEIALRIHVVEKKHESELNRALILPKTINGVPVDVIQTNIKVQSDDMVNDTVSPVIIKPGASIGTTSDTGTIGLIVEEKADSSKVYALTNEHVLTGNEDFTIPGPLDGGNIADVFGKASRNVLSKNLDAALGIITKQKVSFDLSQGSSGVKVVNTAPPKRGSILKMNGSKSDGVLGRIDSTKPGLFKINYPSRGTFDILAFRMRIISRGQNQILKTEKGDSGGVWRSESGTDGVGLHFGSEQDQFGHLAYACPLENVLTELKVTIKK